MGISKIIDLVSWSDKKDEVKPSEENEAKGLYFEDFLDLLGCFFNIKKDLENNKLIIEYYRGYGNGYYHGPGREFPLDECASLIKEQYKNLLQNTLDAVYKSAFLADFSMLRKYHEKREKNRLWQ